MLYKIYIYIFFHFGAKYNAVLQNAKAEKQDDNNLQLRSAKFLRIAESSDFQSAYPANSFASA